MNDPWITGGVLGALLAALLLGLRMVTVPGAVTGAALCTVFLARGGWGTFAAFALLVVGGSLVTRLRVASSDAVRERRGARQALANAGPAALLLMGAPASIAPTVAASALGAAWSDTASSEVGMRAGGRPRLLLFGPRTEVGQDGGMTPWGSLAGLAAASLAGAVASLFHGPQVFLVVVLGALGGNLTDSLLGASVEKHLGPWGNDLVNAVASAVGGVVGWWLLAGAA